MAGENKDRPTKRVRGAQRTTREDWIKTALDTLISDGVDSVKVSVLAAKLDCARSSFYWYFNDRRKLFDALLDYWQHRNTESIVSRAAKSAESINMALVNVFSCWVVDLETGDEPFDSKLDFAIRDWARRDGAVRRAVDISDDVRIGALKGMFERFDYPTGEALIRARIVYYTQIGHEAMDRREDSLTRARTGPDYLYCMTGQPPSQAERDAVFMQAGHMPSDL